MEKKKFRRVVPEDVKVKDLTPLNVVCGTTKCDEGFHCYSQKKSSLRKYGHERVCKQCGADLIDWERIHKNNLHDCAFMFESLKTEIIRHVFWHTPIEEDAISAAKQKGRNGVKKQAEKLLRTRIAKHNNFMDGRQTPMGKDEIVNYAQHATATCCRKCLEAWHNIPMEKPLSDEQLNYCTNLVMKYVDERLPNLPEQGVQKQQTN